MNNTSLESRDVLKFGFYIALVAMIWNLPNLGNNLMPRNFLGWFGMIVISSLVLANAIVQKKILFSRFIVISFIPASAILVHGMLFPPSETMTYYMWLALSASVIFPIFLLSLFQIDDNDKVWLSVSNLLLGVYLFQVLMTEFLYEFSYFKFLIQQLPIELRAKEAGFQQVNLMASFGAALLLWSWSLRLKLSHTGFKSWVFLIVGAFILSLMVFKSGSRTAGLSLLIGASFIFIYSFQFKKSFFSFAVVGSILTAFLFQSFGVLELAGIDGARRGAFASAVTDLAADDSANGRLIMWHVSFLAGLNNMFFGNGLGSFSQAYYETYAINFDNYDYFWRHIPNIMHPHNELLIHWVEMGLFGVMLVALPAIFFLLRLIVRRSSYSVLLISSMLPIVIHSQTEMVLHASGWHWFLLGLIFSSLISRDWLSPYRLPSSVIVAPIFLGLFGCYSTLSIAHISSQAWLNKTSADRAQNLGLHLKRLTQGDELNHWIFATETNDRVIKIMMSYALNTKNTQAIRKFLPRLVDMNNRWQQVDAWAMIAQAYLSLGDMDAYKKHMGKVSKFDATFAASLSKQFDIKVNPAN